MSLSARLLEISSRISQIPLSYYSTQLSSLVPKTSFSPHMHQISKLTILVLTITSIFYFTFISSHFSSSSYRTFSLTTSGRKGAFVNSLSATDIDGPYDNSTLVELCRSREWRKGLIFRCEAPGSGLVESRNVMLNCLRFGIEAGGISPHYSHHPNKSWREWTATGFIIPVLKASEEETLPFNHLFDLDHFTSTLTASCPQIKIISHFNDLWDKPSTSPAVLLSPNSLHSIEPALPLIHSTILVNPGNWSSAFKTSLNTSHPRAPTEKLPVLVTLSPPPLLQFPTTYDSAPFITNFGKLIRSSPELRRLAGAILYALSQKHNLNLPPTPQIQTDAFYGAVLSSSKAPEEAPEESPDPDPKEERTPSPKAQPDLTTSLLLAASSTNLKTIYLSTPHSAPGSVSHFRATGALETLTTLAQNLSIALETAESLLGGSVPTSYVPEEGEVSVTVVARPGAKGFEAEWSTYQSLTSSQKEILDFEVLSRASLFGGNWENSLSWGVALKRHVVASGGQGKWDAVSGGEVGGAKKGKGKAAGTKRAGVEKRPVVDIAKEKIAASPTPTPKNRPRPTRSAARKPTATNAKPSPTTTKGKVPNKGGGAAKGKGAGQGKGKGKPSPTIKGETCFRDELSVVFGPRGEGKAWVLGGWPWLPLILLLFCFFKIILMGF
jgi:hypothetical protein